MIKVHPPLADCKLKIANRKMQMIDLGFIHWELGFGHWDLNKWRLYGFTVQK